MSLRQYAAIKLRVPESGAGWLDEMILKSLRNEFAGMALFHIINGHKARMEHCARSAYRLADAMLVEKGESLRDAVLRVANECNCRAENGADGAEHLLAIEKMLRAALGQNIETQHHE